MQALLRTAARRGTAVARQQGRRLMSGKISHEEEVKEMNKWRIVTYVGACNLADCATCVSPDACLCPALPDRAGFCQSSADDTLVC